MTFRKSTLIFLAWAMCAGLPGRTDAQSTSDILELRIESPYFSPNGDEIQDKAYFTPVLIADWDVTRWRLEIFGPRKKLIFRTTGPGFSTLLEWDGTDRRGQLQPDGEYEAVLQAWGPGFKLKSAPQSVWIDNTPPTCDMQLHPETPAEGPFVFQAGARDNIAVDRWQFQVLDLTGRTVAVRWSSGPVSNITWDGTYDSTHLPVPKGPYKAVFQVWDRAGNESVPAFVDFAITVSTQDEMKALLVNIAPVTTPLGLVIQFESTNLFVSVKGKPQLRRKAYAMLNEVALLINAYPPVSVRLDGYSNYYKNGAKDRNLSSLIAWDVYNYLVKQGNIKASRLTVRGRGQQAPEDREGYELEPIKNGIEIILIGQGPW